MPRPYGIAGRSGLAEDGPVHALQQALKDLDQAYQNFFAGRITLSRRTGQWFASVQCEREMPEPILSALPTVDIDMGVAVFAALSDGISIAPVNHGKKALRALRKDHRALARKKRGSAKGTFRVMLAYKLADRGGRLVEVSAAYTSQTCPVCGHVSVANRQSQTDFVCVACGHADNADTNSAINILRRADSALKPVEGHRTKRPGEAGTRQRAA